MAVWSCKKLRACVSSHFSRVLLFETPCTVALQAPLSMGFSRQEYWSGLPCLSPEDLPNPGFKLGFSALQVDSLPAEPQGKPKLLIKSGKLLTLISKYYFWSFTSLLGLCKSHYIYIFIIDGVLYISNFLVIFLHCFFFCFRLYNHS